MTVRIDKHADELLQGQAMNCTEENATLTWLLMAVHADMEMKKKPKKCRFDAWMLAERKACASSAHIMVMTRQTLQTVHTNIATVHTDIVTVHTDSHCQH